MKGTESKEKHTAFPCIIYMCLCNSMSPDAINYATCNTRPVKLMFL